MGQRFLNHVRSHSLSDDVIDAARADWQDDAFTLRAVREIIGNLAPSYTVPTGLQVTLAQRDDDSFALESNLDWPRLQSAWMNTSDGGEVNAGHFLISMLEMRGHLHLSATFGASVAQDPLGAKLMQAKCADLTAALDTQQNQIDQFHEIVVAGLADLRSVVNSGECSFSDFLGLLAEAEQFRDWLHTQTPDANLVQSYFNEVTKKRWIDSRPVKELRWLLPSTAGFAYFLPVPGAELVAPATAGTLAAADRFLLARLAGGWRPASFIDTKMRPFVSR